MNIGMRYICCVYCLYKNLNYRVVLNGSSKRQYMYAKNLVSDENGGILLSLLKVSLKALAPVI